MIVKNLFKWVATGTIVVVTLFSAVIIYISFAVDVNGFKPDIESLARQQGVNLAIDGDLAWTFFPQPGISIGQVRFSDQLATSGTLDSLTLTVAWTDLLAISGDPSQIPMGSVQISGGQVRYKALNNLPVQLSHISLSSRNISLAGKRFPLAVSARAFGGQKLSLETDIAMSANGQTIDRLVLSDLQLRINQIEINGKIEASNNLKWIQGNFKTNSFNLQQQLANFEKALPELALTETTKPSALFELSISSGFTIDDTNAEVSNLLTLDGQPIEVNMLVDQPRNKLTTKISANLFRVADYMPVADAGTNNSSLFAPLAIPFALWQGQSQVEVSINKIQFDGFVIDNFYGNLFGNQRVLSLTSLNADVFNGEVNAIARLDMRPAAPRFSLQPSFNNIDLALALPAIADYSALTGRLNLDTNIQGSGNSTASILKSFSGVGKFELRSPSYADFNIEQAFCNAAALFGSSEQAKQNWSTGTDLENLRGSFQLSQGNLNINEYSTATGNLNIIGRGSIGLIKQNYSIAANARLDAATTSNNGCAVNKRLQNRQIPFICKGKFDGGSASCKPDERVLKDLLKNTAFEKLGEQILKRSDKKDDPLTSLLNEFLKRKLN